MSSWYDDESKYHHEKMFNNWMSEPKRISSYRVTPMTPSDCFKANIFKEDKEYYLNEDIDFMSKLKAMYPIDSYRRTGRSIALAKVYIELAIKTGRRVYFEDHVSIIEGDMRRHRAGNDMVSLIREVIYKDYRHLFPSDTYVLTQEYLEIIHVDYSAFDRMRIPTFVPASKYVMGCDPYQKEDKQLLLICCTI